MISDVLFEAVDEIERYLKDMPDTYEGELRERILKLVEDMTKIRIELDTPPKSNEFNADDLEIECGDDKENE